MAGLAIAAGRDVEEVVAGEPGANVEWLLVCGGAAVAGRAAGATASVAIVSMGRLACSNVEPKTGTEAPWTLCVCRAGRVRMTVEPRELRSDEETNTNTFMTI